MKKSFIALLCASAIALGACNGTRKVNFEKFKEKVEEAAKAEKPKVKQYVVKGTVEEDGKETKFDKVKITSDMSAADLLKNADTIALVESLSALITASVAKEDEDVNYYVGNGFRVKEDKNSMSWDKYLNITSFVSKDDDFKANLTVTWKYDK